MKYIPLLLILLLAACRSTIKESFIGTPDSFPASNYTIALDRDTTLVTVNGAILKIPKGAITGSGNTATLEIKEAYSIEQILRAGLNTTSDGKPLSSGGMIAINAVGGENVKITQAIKVSIPTSFVDPDMKLYKGEKTADGKINWTNPTEMTDKENNTALSTGANLFQNNCSSCHAIGKDGAGPDLAHLMKRFGDRELYYFHVLDVFRMSEKDSGHRNFHDEHNESLRIYKCNVREWFGSVGQSFWPGADSSHTGIDFKALFTYIQNESDRRNLPLPAQDKLMDCADSCAIYNRTVRSLQELRSKSESERKKLIEDNEELSKFNNMPTSSVPTIPDSLAEIPKPASPAPPKPPVVTPERYQSTYYNFEITTFGWYNVDVLVEGKNDTQESQLFVRITGQYLERINIYLIVPNVRAILPGGVSDRGAHNYAFDSKNGKIFLPQGVKAYILAFTETKESIAFGLKEFSTSQMQELSISLASATTKQFEIAIKNLDLPEFNAVAKPSKNADSIRARDSIIKKTLEELKGSERLKPKGCNCDCSEPSITRVSAAVESYPDIIPPPPSTKAVSVPIDATKKKQLRN